MPAPQTRPDRIAPDTHPPFTAIIASPLPETRIGARCNQQGIYRLQFLPLHGPCYQPQSGQPYHHLIEQLCTALQHYFTRPETDFQLPLAASGSMFQHRVWQAISTIPSGETLSYGQLARQLDSSARAIGGACRANPLPLLVPCHRVIAANGQQGGFLGQTGNSAAIKHWLLQHEHGTISNHAHQH
jgi:methylated-DNA-[protein]-cysteine S-methyltransferase